MGGNKNKVFIVIYKKNRQLIRKQIIPKNDSFDVNGKSYIIDAENYYIFKGKACYTYLEDLPSPLAVKDILVTKDKKELIPIDVLKMSADDLHTFKKAKTAKEILDTVDNSLPDNLVMMALFGVMVLGFAFLWFTFSNQYTELTAMMRELLEVFAGGGR